jgi:ADP-ribosylglycohydrolase
MVMASFLADSFALGPHWIYDTGQIKEKFGEINQLTQPQPGSYHSNKQKGDFTHYGDQALVLLKSVSENNGFKVDNFCSDWQNLFADYSGYIDSATKATLKNLSAGASVDSCGSSSTDLGGAARIAALIYKYHQDKASLHESVIQQTIMTHNHPATITGAQFLADTVANTLQGESPQKSIENVLDKGVSDIDLDNRIRAALDSKGEDTKEVIKNFGQACSISSALPGAVHLAVSYPDNLARAFCENVMAGGDSAARGMAAGMILGAHLGSEALPESWLKEMSASPVIADLLENI